MHSERNARVDATEGPAEDMSGDRSASPQRTAHRASVRTLKFPKDDSDPFFRAATQRVRRYLHESGQSRYGGWRLMLKGGLIGAAVVGFYLQALLGDTSVAVTLLFAILFGVSALLFAINIGHEAAHDTIVPGKLINRVIQFLAFAPVGADAELWKLRHVKSHHISPNVRDFDVDSAENGIVRLSPYQKHHWFNRGQAFYTPFVFWLVDLHAVLVDDFKYMIRGRMANIGSLQRDAFAVGVFIAQKVAFAAILFMIPIAVMDLPAWQILLGAFIVTFVNSLVFVYLLIGTHHCEEVDYLEPDENDRVDKGWAHHQLATSMDWSPLNPLANFVAGGANAHAAHHLFPNYSHVHYIPITRIIQDEAARHGMPYHETTLPRMIASHFRHLHRLGRGEDPGTARGAQSSS